MVSAPTARPAAFHPFEKLRNLEYFISVNGGR